MSVAWKSSGPSAAGTGTQITVNRPGGVAVGDLLIVILGFEGVAAGSGPWVVPGDGSDTTVVGEAEGWKQVCYQAPAATGCGLEVWAAIHISGDHEKFNLVGSLSYVAETVSYTGAYDALTGTISDGAIRGATTEQVSGDSPNSPAIHAFENELLIVVGADTLASPGWGAPTPAGWSSRADVKRGAYGTVEVTAADKPITVEADYGPIPFSAAASPSGADGATATLAVRPNPPAATSPLIAVEFAVAD